MTSRNVTVVTGASSGIGRAASEHLAGSGDRVWALMRNPDDGAELAETVHAHGGELAVLPCDVTSDASVDEAFAQILRSDGRIDRLVNNAGIFVGSVLELHPIEDIRAVFEVNYFGALRCIQRAIPVMRRARAGRIVAISSQSARFVMPGWTAYSGSKRALEASLEALATETRGFGIRVSVVEPGSTVTAMRGKIRARDYPADYESVLARYRAVVAADRTDRKTAEDVAKVIAGLLDHPDPPFREIVGADAERNLAIRERAGDDGWIALFSHDTDDGFFAAWTELSGWGDPRLLVDDALVDPH